MSVAMYLHMGDTKMLFAYMWGYFSNDLMFFEDVRLDWLFYAA